MKDNIIAEQLDNSSNISMSLLQDQIFLLVISSLVNGTGKYSLCNPNWSLVLMYPFVRIFRLPNLYWRNWSGHALFVRHPSMSSYLIYACPDTQTHHEFLVVFQPF